MWYYYFYALKHPNYAGNTLETDLQEPFKYSLDILNEKKYATQSITVYFDKILEFF